MARGAIGFEVDLDPVYDRIVAGAKDAVDDAAQYALGRIRAHAPVRKIFAGTTYQQKQLPTNRGIQSFRVPVQRAISFGQETGTHQGSLRKDTIGTSERARVVGHANSEIPVFRFRRGDATVRISGDFRAIGKMPSPRATLTVRPNPMSITAGRPKEIEASPQEALIAAGKLIKLTSAGRYEANHPKRSRFVGEDGVARIGGRLKGELKVQGARQFGQTVWAYVISETVDPNTGYPYPAAQEFGSSHNRPHPFMRPGLHESRSALVSATKRNVRAGSQQ